MKSSELGNAYLSNKKKDYSYQCMWTILKLAGSKQNISPTWKIQVRDVELGEPTSFLTMCIWVALEEKSSKDILDSYRSMFECRIFWGAMEKLSEARASGNLMEKQHLHVLRHGRSRGEMCGKMLQICK